MLSHGKLTAVLLFWLLAAGLYVAAGARQSARLNLSAAAGGQYPYLKYAEGIARDGPGAYFGDRNRMPLVPALLSMVFFGNPRFAFPVLPFICMHAAWLLVLASRSLVAAQPAGSNN